MDYHTGRLMITADDVARWASIALRIIRRRLRPSAEPTDPAQRLAAAVQQELSTAQQLLRQNQHRAAGAVAGVALELHLKHVACVHGLEVRPYASSCRGTLKRLDKAFQAFFRRLKSGEVPGYPRFKGRNRFDTVEFPEYGNGCKLDGNRIYFHHIGRVRVKFHRPIEGTIKTVSFTRQADGWHAIITSDLGNVEVVQRRSCGGY